MLFNSLPFHEASLKKVISPNQSPLITLFQQDNHTGLLEGFIKCPSFLSSPSLSNGSVPPGAAGLSQLPFLLVLLVLLSPAWLLLGGSAGGTALGWPGEDPPALEYGCSHFPRAGSQ